MGKSSPHQHEGRFPTRIISFLTKSIQKLSLVPVGISAFVVPFSRPGLHTVVPIQISQHTAEAGETCVRPVECLGFQQTGKVGVKEFNIVISDGLSVDTSDVDSKNDRL